MKFYMKLLPVFLVNWIIYFDGFELKLTKKDNK